MASKVDSAPVQQKGKAIKSEIEQQLETALAPWKEELGEKKFKRRIKKAGKVFSKNLKRSSSEPTSKKKVEAPKEKSKVA
jgi:hypothetical protein